MNARIILFICTVSMTFVSVIYLTGFNIVVKILLKRSHVLTILGGKGPFYEFQ